MQEGAQLEMLCTCNTRRSPMPVPAASILRGSIYRRFNKGHLAKEKIEGLKILHYKSQSANACDDHNMCWTL